MIKKNEFNIMLFVVITVLIIILSCKKGTNITHSGILIKTDMNFSLMSVEDGMFKAFLYYMAEDGVILRDNSLPERGKEILRQRFSGKSDTNFILRWEPLYEKISISGDLGYTYGIHTTTDKTSGEVSSGTYITIWEKQADGNWKFVLDTGTQGLPDNLQQE
jgi:ketosteroid isomerase-like protein